MVNDGKVCLSREVALCILEKVTGEKDSVPHLPIGRLTEREMAIFKRWKMGEKTLERRMQNLVDLAHSREM